jgi:tetratricopeptide (TPR) repeat protein
VDLVVGDFMGRFVVDDAMLDAVAAAGAWLRPGGGFLPSRLRLWLAPAGGFRMPSLDWVDATAYGLDLRPMTSHVLHQSYGGDFHESLLLATAQTYAEIIPPHAPPFDAELAFVVARPGMLRGLVGWFEAELAPGITLSTAPDIETHWGQVLYPLTPVAVLPGDLLEVSLRLVAGDAPETEWTARLRRGAEVLLDERLDTRDRPGERPAPAVSTEEADAEELNERGAAAYHAGRPDEALRLWEQATRALRGSGGEWGPRIYENLGIAYLAASQPLPAARAFMRALDGDLSSREQSLRLLIRALEAAGKLTDAAGLKGIYDARFTT